VLAESFPRQHARTRGFTLGRPRSFTVSADGSRVCFLRSRAGADPATCLWALDVATGEERLVATGAVDDDLTPEERARRERARESAGGIVSYAGDDALSVVTYVQGGRVHRIDVASGAVTEVPGPGPAFDARPDPTGQRIAWVVSGALHVDGVELASDDDANVTWGLAEFIAAEEMGRQRGYWWSPDGAQLAVCRVDTTPVARWYIADPAVPSTVPTELAYPAAGTANASVSLWVVDLDGSRLEVTWDAERFPYLARVRWQAEQPLTVLVQSRDQRDVQVLVVGDDGTTNVVHELTDPAWVDLVDGVPAWLPDGALLTVAPVEDTHRLLVDGGAVTPVGLHVRRVVSAGDDIVFTASSDDPTQVHVWKLCEGALEPVTTEPGVHGTAVGGSTIVVSSLTMDGFRCVVGEREIASFEETPGVAPEVTFLTAGERDLRAAVLYPTGHVPGTSVPVLLDPYGGPGDQRVLRSRAAFLTSQWLADQGFAVVVIDGRGTPGRGPAWERSVLGDLATAPLEDQVDGLHAVAAEHPDLDLSRVAIRGWSFGGYLAALAVLRRPDVFHVAIAGAPVTEWRLYDTHYTERYLGHPDSAPDAYAASSLLEDAAKLERPLLLIHGLADDNVVSAHTLQLSSALLAAGRPHTVLPLSGVTHMTPQEVVAENLLLLQVTFLREALGS
jgi:dipeptidyl-peptidase-4